MEKISCNIINDILPLYIDNAVCEDTARLVEEHLEKCPQCRKTEEDMKKAPVIPVSAGEEKPLKKLKRSITRRQIAAVIISAAAAAFAVCLWILPRTAGVTAHSQNLEITANTQFESGEKEFDLELASTVGKALRSTSEYIYSDSGEVVGEVITVYQVKKDRFFGEDPQISFGYTFDNYLNDDFTVTLHLKDKDISYSMKDYGLIGTAQSDTDTHKGGERSDTK